MAITTSATAFFLMAIIGSLCGQAPGVCGLRAIVGAGVVFVLTVLVGRVVFGILADIVVRGGRPNSEHRDDSQ